MNIKKTKTTPVTLAFEDHGSKDAPPLMLVRGQGSQMAHWPRELIDGFLASGLRVILFDNRDVGLSQRCPLPGGVSDADGIIDLLRKGEMPAAPYGIADMARDVTLLMDELAIEKAHIFGVSMGGMIAQQIMLDAPERLRSATLVMSSCRPMSEISADAASLLSLAQALLVKPRTREEYLAGQVQEHGTWGSPGFPMAEHDIRAMAARAYDRGIDADGMNRQVIALAWAADRRPGLANVSLPCLVIHGEDDTLVPLDRGRELADTIPSSRFLAIAGMGHIITPRLAPVIVDHVTGFIEMAQPAPRD